MWRPAKRESDVGGLRLDHVVCDLGANNGASVKTKACTYELVRMIF
jgi:hypothetical protein